MLHVVFRVGDAEYVLPAADVVGMESFTGATRVPGTADHVVGLVQIRNRVVPVVSLRARFGLPPVEASLDHRVIVSRLDGREVALLVDRAREVIDLPPDGFEPPPPVVTERAQGFVRGVSRQRERLLLLVDLPRIVGEAPLPGKGHHASAS